MSHSLYCTDKPSGQTKHHISNSPAIMHLAFNFMAQALAGPTDSPAQYYEYVI